MVFITGSISAPAFAESLERGLKNYPLRPTFTVQRADGRYEATINPHLEARRAQRPIARATTDHGGPIRYRVRHAARRWKSGEAPKLVREVVEGDVQMMV